MATAENQAPSLVQPTFSQFFRSGNGRRIALGVAAAAIIAVMVSVWMWSQRPDYRVLFSNFTDKDGGAIVTVLQQMNVPYRFSDGGTAILVPSDQVNDLRLKLAAQNLPRSGNVGFEIMENQKLGTSQFLEQINYQRALEGELASTIESINAVQAARVHLALPKPSVFVREQQKPSASVLLNLQPGRALDPGQVSAIIHLVASSVANLTPDEVTVVDQNGTLLSDNAGRNKQNGLDPDQLKYVQQLQQDIASRIETIISPIVGSSNVRAEVTADVDFSNSQQAAETYGPNPTPQTSSVRSKEEDITKQPGAGASGIPGALTNQPPAPATAPVNAQPNAQPGAPGATAAAGTAASTTAADNVVHQQSSTNYELNKTVRYTVQPMGGIKRLSVAVVVNYKTETDKKGKTKQVPLTAAEKQQIADLAREAMGFDQARGDTLNVVNSEFAPVNNTLPEIPWWKRQSTIDLAMTAGRYLLGAILLFIIYRKFLRPILDRLIIAEPVGHRTGGHHGHEPGHADSGPHADASFEDDADVSLSAEAEAQLNAARQYEKQLEKVREVAKDNPKIVATIIKNWISNE